MVILHHAPPLTCEIRTNVKKTHQGIYGESSFDAKVNLFMNYELCIISIMDQSSTCLLGIHVLLWVGFADVVIMTK
jgi:hypothetical protein